MKISLKKVVLYTVMEILGLVLAVIFGLVAAIVGTWWGYVLFFVSLGTSFAGNFLRDCLYRCPRCNHLLLKRRYFRPYASDRLYDHCPGCGWRVILEEE